LRSVSVQNYKAIGPGKLDLELAPITILVGKNNAGKSSVIEAIALTAQSALADPGHLECVLSGGGRGSCPPGIHVAGWFP